MEISYNLYDSYYDTSSDLREEPLFGRCFRTKDDLIRYLNLRCVAERGKGFVYAHKYPSKMAYYSKPFFSSTYRYVQSEPIPGKDELLLVESDELGMYRNWEGYLADIEKMLDGIDVIIETQEMVDLKPQRPMFYPKELRLDRRGNLRRIQYAFVTYNVSEVYSSRIYEKRNIFLKHREVFDKLATIEKKEGYCSIYVGREGVSLDTRRSMCEEVLFSDFGLQSLAGELDCFVFADALMEYISRKYEAEFEFSCVGIDISGGVKIGNGHSCVSLHYCTKEKPKIDENQLNSW